MIHGQYTLVLVDGALTTIALANGAMRAATKPLMLCSQNAERWQSAKVFYTGNSLFQAFGKMPAACSLRAVSMR